MYINVALATLETATLHVIVHREMLECAARINCSSGILHRQHLDPLRRIDYISSWKKHALFLPYEGENMEDDPLLSVAALCKGHDTIILYGVARAWRLQLAARKLMNEGFCVAYGAERTPDFT